MPSDKTWGIAPPLIELPIRTATRGFYDGFSRQVTIPSKIIVSLIILWAIFFPVSANETLTRANSTIISSFAGWYVYLVAALIAVCGLLAIVPGHATAVLDPLTGPVLDASAGALRTLLAALARWCPEPLAPLPPPVPGLLLSLLVVASLSSLAGSRREGRLISRT